MSKRAHTARDSDVDPSVHLITIEEAAKVIKERPGAIRHWINKGILAITGNKEERCILVRDLHEAWSKELNRRAEQSAKDLGFNANAKNWDITRRIDRIPQREIERRVMQSRREQASEGHHGNKVTAGYANTIPESETGPEKIEIVAQRLQLERSLILHLIRINRVELHVLRGDYCVRAADVRRVLDEDDHERARELDAKKERRKRILASDERHRTHSKNEAKRRREPKAKQKQIDLTSPMPIKLAAALLDIAQSEIWLLTDQGRITMFTRHSVPAVRPADVIAAERDYYERVEKMTKEYRPHLAQTPTSIPISGTGQTGRQSNIPQIPQRSQALSHDKVSIYAYGPSGQMRASGRNVSAMFERLAELERRTDKDDASLREVMRLRNDLRYIAPDQLKTYLDESGA